MQTRRRQYQGADSSASHRVGEPMTPSETAETTQVRILMGLLWLTFIVMAVSFAHDRGQMSVCRELPYETYQHIAECLRP